MWRGGSWESWADDCRVAHRECFNYGGIDVTGFRVVRRAVE